MGEYACLGEDVDCYSVGKVSIGDQATVSQGARLCSAGHDIASRTMELTVASVIVEANSWVAGWAIILPGVTVGEGAVVGAGAVVAKDVAPWTVVVGNPARCVRDRQQL